MCHVPACLRGLCQKPCFLSIHCTHRHTRPHMQLHIERNACGEAAALCCFFFFCHADMKNAQIFELFNV